ncbi:MAG: aspartate/glutamate racemase family protein [Ferruginibacter sp.]
MKTIGLIGGITWYSTLDYYRLLNELVNKRLGGVHAAKIILNSVDFAVIKDFTEKEDWNAIAKIICNAARSVEAAGADCVLMAANTMHNIAHLLDGCMNIPLIHIADTVATALNKQNIKKTALLGTKYTMQMDFYKDKLALYGIDTIIPNEAGISFINNSIYEEFGKGIFLPATKERYLGIISDLIKEGAEAVIFGCTEIPILLKDTDCGIPAFDSGHIHATAAVDFALG